MPLSFQIFRFLDILAIARRRLLVFTVPPHIIYDRTPEYDCKLNTKALVFVKKEAPATDDMGLEAPVGVN
jgi:hypothetical protein